MFKNLFKLIFNYLFKFKGIFAYNGILFGLPGFPLYIKEEHPVSKSQWEIKEILFFIFKNKVEIIYPVSEKNIKTSSEPDRYLSLIEKDWIAILKFTETISKKKNNTEFRETTFNIFLNPKNAKNNC